MSTPARVLLICSDLFFSTQLRSAAQSAGAQADVELSAARIGERTATAAYSLIVIDLEMTSLDLAAALAALPAENRPHVLAFGPHVQAQRLKAARDAGCDTVVPRSVAAETLAKIVDGR
jgi:DNA-binding NarL/FixJ family response regulator